jgi:hypothetical protein
VSTCTGPRCSEVIPYHQKWIEHCSRFGSVEFDLDRESKCRHAAADAGTERNQCGARTSLKARERGTHAERPFGRMLDHLDILRTGERGQSLEFIERKVPIRGALAGRISAPGQDAGHAYALGHMVERMPTVVFRIALRIDIVPER